MRLFGVAPAVAAAFIVILMSQAHPADLVPKVDGDMTSIEQRLLGPLARIVDPEGHGSGFFVSNNMVVTARHVIEGLSDTGAYVFDIKGNRHRILERHIAYDSDVGIVVVDNPDPEQLVAMIKCELPNRFDTLVAAGSPLTVNNIASPQMVVGWDETRDVDDVVSMILSGDIDPGMSGGPVYNLDGMVVGVVSNRSMFEVNGEQLALSSFNRAVPLANVPELCQKKVEDAAPVEEVQPEPGEPEAEVE